MPQGKRALAGMKSRSRLESWRRSMPCTLPHMEKAMTEGLQVRHTACLAGCIRVIAGVYAATAVPITMIDLPVATQTIVTVMRTNNTCAVFCSEAACAFDLSFRCMAAPHCWFGLCTAALHCFHSCCAQNSQCDLQASMRPQAWKTSLGA